MFKLFKKNDEKKIENIAEKVFEAEKTAAKNVDLRATDIKYLMDFVGKNEKAILSKYLSASKGQAYVSVPRSEVESIMERMPYAKSERFFIKRLEEMMKHAAKEYVTLPSADLKKLISLGPKEQRIKLEHILEEQKGENIKVLTKYVEAAIEAYKRERIPHKHEGLIYKAAAVVLLLAATPLLIPPGITGYAFYSSNTPLGYGFFNILLGFVSLAVASYLLARKK